MDGTAEKSQKKSIKPGFLGGKGGGETPIGLNTENPGLGREEAAKNLNSAEKAAEGGLYNRGDNLDGAREAEKGGFYSSDAAKKVSAMAAMATTKASFKGRFKKGGPLVGVLFVIFLVGAMMGGTQFFQPFSLIAQFQETFNSMEKSANSRSSRWIRWQLMGDYVKDPVKGSAFGKSKFKITSKQEEELKKQGIEYDKDGNGGKGVLKYTDSSGEVKEVTADNFRETFDTDSDFFHKYSAGSMTWRGQFANWFGMNTTNFLKNNKITRNLWNKFKEARNAADGDGIKVAKEKISNRAKTVTDGGFRVVGKGEEEERVDGDGNKTQIGTDDEGNPIYEKAPALEGDTGGGGSYTRGDVDAIRKKLDGISSKFNGAASIGCGVMGAIGAVNLLVAADEALQIITIASGYFEAVHKTQAGHGDDTPINELTNTINEKHESTYEIVDDDGLGSHEEKMVGTAMQAAGIAALYGGGKVNPRDPSVQSFNVTASATRLLGGVGLGVEAFENCLAAKTVTALASAAIDAVTIGACIAGALGAVITGGLSLLGCSGLAGKIAGQIALGAAVGGAVELMMAVLAPVAKSILMRDLTELVGVDLGNALTYGANTYQGGAHLGNGGSLSTIRKYERYGVLQQQVIAENARYERETRDPFDITSKYTFMGSIMSQLMSFNTASSLMSTVTTGGSVMSSSLVGLVSPAATAYEIADFLPDDMEEYRENCPYLASINAVGDSYCNPYIMTDIDTMDTMPGAVIDKLADPNGDGDYSDSNFEDDETSDGNVIIKDGSRLSKYIEVCTTRTSGWGMVDQNVANNAASFADVRGTPFDGLINGAIGSAPVVGDVIEVVQDEQQRAVIGYIDGESCVASDDESIDLGANAPNWGTAKYYQRFIEDQSLAESIGLVEKSAVAAYLEKVAMSEPEDNSYEGMLARYSGLDKETVSDLLDVIAYYDYINNYDASERYMFDGVAEREVERVILFNEENILDGDVVRPENIVYADVRNRTFVV